ncbi:hypothetical protein BsWGS_20257 [Bradybaena similaris]
MSCSYLDFTQLFLGPLGRQGQCHAGFLDFTHFLGPPGRSGQFHAGFLDFTHFLGPPGRSGQFHAGFLDFTHFLGPPGRSGQFHAGFLDFTHFLTHILDWFHLESRAVLKQTLPGCEYEDVITGLGGKCAHHRAAAAPDFM